MILAWFFALFNELAPHFVEHRAFRFSHRYHFCWAFFFQIVFFITTIKYPFTTTITITITITVTVTIGMWRFDFVKAQLCCPVLFRVVTEQNNRRIVYGFILLSSCRCRCCHCRCHCRRRRRYCCLHCRCCCRCFTLIEKRETGDEQILILKSSTWLFHRPNAQKHLTSHNIMKNYFMKSA